MAKCRCRETCSALKVLFPSLYLMSTAPTPESWRVQIPACWANSRLVSAGELSYATACFAAKQKPDTRSHPSNLCKVIESSAEANIVIPGPRFPLSRVLGASALPRSSWS